MQVSLGFRTQIYDMYKDINEWINDEQMNFSSDLKYFMGGFDFLKSKL